MAVKQKVQRREACPIESILDRRSGRRIGLVYRWNDGSTVKYWADGPRDDVVFEDLPPRPGSGCDALH